MNKQEIWKDITGYAGIYKISDHGRIWSNYKNRIISGRNNGYGYIEIILCKNGIHKNHMAHKLVAREFIVNDNPSTKIIINHKDENKSNNRAENLEWCDYSYNNSYGSKSRIQTEKLGRKVRQYDLKGALIKTWGSILSVHKITGINDSSITQCCQGKRNKAGGFIWRYADEC